PMSLPHPIFILVPYTTLFRSIILVVFVICSLTACNDSAKQETSDNMTTQSDTIHFTNGYSDVNGIKMYYEIYGEGKPLVLIHGGDRKSTRLNSSHVKISYAVF